MATTSRNPVVTVVVWILLILVALWALSIVLGFIRYWGLIIVVTVAALTLGFVWGLRRGRSRSA